MTGNGPRGSMPRSPLHEAQREGRAAFGDVDGWLLPRSYGDLGSEYAAVKRAAALIDRSQHGRLRVSGANRIDLLNRLTTNDLRGITPGQGARTIMLTDKGRIIDVLHVHAGEDHLLLVTSPLGRERVKGTIEKLRFRDDVSVEDWTAGSAMIALLGPEAPALLAASSGPAGRGDLPPYHAFSGSLGGARVVVARIRDVGDAGFHIFMEAPSAPAVWKALLSAHDCSPCGEEAYEMVRVEAGLPRSGRELTEDYNPLEAGLGDAISWTKGCYVGQEVVARLDSRQKVSKVLVGLRADPGPVPEAGAVIEPEGRPGTAVGRLTSVAPSIDGRCVLGLGYVRTDHSAAGTRLAAVSAEDRLGLEVAEPAAGAPGHHGWG